MNVETILNFWFKELTPQQWWKKDPLLDEHIKSRFALIHHHATQGELFEWRDTAEGCLAEIIILDQFSRNIFRNQPQSFAYDGMALVLAQEAIRKEFNKQLSTSQKAFLYLPFMHSESLEMHQHALKLFAEPGLESNFDFEKKHLEIIKRFGHYPHRNSVLGRPTTDEEELFLKDNPGF